MDVDIRFVDILRFVDTFSESENATNEKTQEIQVFFFAEKNTKKFASLIYIIVLGPYREQNLTPKMPKCSL